MNAQPFDLLNTKSFGTRVRARTACCDFWPTLAYIRVVKTCSHKLHTYLHAYIHTYMATHASSQETSGVVGPAGSVRLPEVENKSRAPSSHLPKWFSDDGQHGYSSTSAVVAPLAVKVVRPSPNETLFA